MMIDPAKLKEALLKLCDVIDAGADLPPGVMRSDSIEARNMVGLAFVDETEGNLPRLEPCPFCRGRANLWTKGLPVTARFCAECEDCHIATRYEATIELAAAAWNRRAVP